MGLVSFTSGGSFKNTEAFLNAMNKLDIASVLESAGQAGVAALQQNMPQRTGLAAHSWSYVVETSGKSSKITWLNYDIENGFPVAIMLQYGYGTGTGGYVQGRDYINPSMQPVFDAIAERVWRAVTSA